ncbi:MAG: asparaginase [Dermatophilaceae bacterium]
MPVTPRTLAAAPVPEPAPTTPAALDEAPVVAHVVRSGLIESVHRASIAVTGAGGALVEWWGEVADPVLPRSSNKPLQAVAMVRAGLSLPPRHLALACASHSGEPFHLDGVREMLAAAGLDEADLQNTPDLPYDEREREAWLAAGHVARPLAQNCSGKHAAMLATCVANGWPADTYRDVDHPLQRAIASTIAELAAESVASWGVDGCGAPVFAISLAGLARAFGRIAAASPGTPEATVAGAMRAHPDHLGGTRRDVTALVRGTDGLVAKDGAEGVYAVGLADGRGVALKIADGAQRPRPVLMAALLRRLGVASSAYGRMEDAPVLGHGEPVGRVVAVGIHKGG